MITAKDGIGQTDFLSGTLLLIDKPQDWTSFDVVNKVRWAIRRRLNIKKVKVGHSGTLDPMATGLLLVCTGKWTKRLHELQGLPKQYIGKITLGGETASYDKESEVTKEYSLDGVSSASVNEALKGFIGDIKQLPPMFSAIKVKGKPLYKLARKGETIELEPRQVSIQRFEMTKCALPDIDFIVECSKGTYVRSMAHDLGKILGCGGYLSALRRTSVGDYTVDDAWQLDSLIETIENEIIVSDKQNTVI
jgi:tRNA pseudouridine55 synthase